MSVSECVCVSLSVIFRVYGRVLVVERRDRNIGDIITTECFCGFVIAG